MGAQGHGNRHLMTIGNKCFMCCLRIDLSDSPKRDRYFRKVFLPCRGKNATLNLMRLLSMTSRVQLYRPVLAAKAHKLNPEPIGTKDRTREIIATLAGTNMTATQSQFGR